jgi:hypothetical protein
MTQSPGTEREVVYQAPLSYLLLFYGFLVLWVLISVYLLGTRSEEAGWPLTQLLMVAFVIAYTWFFSLGISYRIRLEAGGNFQLTSFRRALKVHATDVDMLEGPRFGLPFGFIRFRLTREKAYLFCVVTDTRLQEVLSGIRKANPDMKIRFLRLGS